MKRLLILAEMIVILCSMVSAQHSCIASDKPPIESIDTSAFNELLEIGKVAALRYSSTMIWGGYRFCNPREYDPLWEVAAGLPARFESYDLLMGHPLSYDIPVIINRYDENERELILAFNRIRHNRRLK